MIAPEDAVNVRVLLPNGVPLLVVIVSMELFDVASVMFTGVGLKFADAPAGNPPALRFTVPVKPASGVTVTVYCTLLPGVTDRDEGVAVMAKSGVVDAGAEATKVK